jgi:hypothetical protein
MTNWPHHNTFRHCKHIGADPDQHLLESGPTDFETWIDWILRTTKEDPRDHQSDMEMVVPKLQHPGSTADGQLHNPISETGAACPFYPPVTDDMPMLTYFVSTSMGRCTKITRSVAALDERIP